MKKDYNEQWPSQRVSRASESLFEPISPSQYQSAVSVFFPFIRLLIIIIVISTKTECVYLCCWIQIRSSHPKINPRDVAGNTEDEERFPNDSSGRASESLFEPISPSQYQSAVSVFFPFIRLMIVIIVISTKTECVYLCCWIQIRSHMQKSHPKMVNPRDVAGNTEDEERL